MSVVTQLFRAACIALIALVSVQAASARGHAPAVGSMVICTGHGPIMVMLDAEGQPTGGLMICPDYALSLVAHVTANTPPLASEVHWHHLHPVTYLARHGAMTTLTACARGPPVSV